MWESDSPIDYPKKKKRRPIRLYTNLLIAVALLVCAVVIYLWQTDESGSVNESDLQATVQVAVVLTSEHTDSTPRAVIPTAIPRTAVADTAVPAESAGTLSVEPWGFSGAISPDGQFLTVQDIDGNILIWDIASNEEVQRLVGNEDSVWSMEWSPDGQFVAIGGHDGMVRVWDVASGEETLSLSGHWQPVRSVDWSPDGKVLASISLDKLFIWDVAERRAFVEIDVSGAGISVDWSPDGKWLAYSGGGINLIERDADGTLLLPEQYRQQKYPGALAWSPDGKHIAYSGDRIVHIWDVKNQSVLYEFYGHLDGIESVQWSADGLLVASHGDDGLIFIWNVATGEAAYKIGDVGDEVSAVKWSPDGTQVYIYEQEFSERQISVWSLSP